MRSRRINTVFVECVLLAALTALPAFDGWSMGSRVPKVGMQAEDFRLTDLEGKSQSLSQYRGKIVLVNFWATWCKPCTTETPAMQKIYDKLRDKGFVVLAVNELEDDAKVREHIKQYNVVEAALAGGHICTMPFSIFQQLVKHPLTDLGVNKFLADWNTQLQKSPTDRKGIPLWI